MKAKRHAYVFYATDVMYAISVLVFVRLLKNLGISKDADVIVFHLALPNTLIELMRKMGILTMLVSGLNHVGRGYYAHCLIKLRVFTLTTYERAVFIDADAIPLKSLDELLDLPLEDGIAAPAAYWLPQPYWTTALLVVTPSANLWHRIRKHFPSLLKGLYDMDIVNLEFAKNITTLPQRMFALNSEWEDTVRGGLFKDPTDAIADISVVHFTALGKPWMYSMEEVYALRPNAHQVFYELWELWLTTREEIRHA